MSNLFLFTDHYHYFLYQEPVNMNKSFNGLEGLIKKKLKREMNEQDMFVFFNKHLTHIKIFGYSKRKYSLIYERLHRGTFKVASSNQKGAIEISANELLKIIRCIHLNGNQK
jgi:transposase